MVSVLRWTDGSVISSGTTVRDAIANGVVKGVSFSCADLSNADLMGLDLSGVDFTEADLSGADFRECKLTNTNFVDAFIYKTKGLADSVLVSD